ncbi:MAG: DMT family transporter [Alphaproteobacteria bacterium]|nr:DMT family transporter [Alphaproteobacteria bacterium]
MSSPHAIPRHVPLAHPLAMPALVLGAFAIGASPIFVRWSEIGPVATAFHRMLWALPPLWLWMRWEMAAGRRPRLRPGDAWALTLAGLFFVGDLIFWHWSIGHTSVANATLFANFAPIVVALGAWALFGQRITSRFLAGMCLAFAGAAILLAASSGFGGGRLLGDAYGLVTACFFGAYMLAIAGLRARLPTAFVMFWSSLVTCLGLLAASLIAGERLWPSSWAGLWVLVALAVVSQAAGQGLLAFALGHLPAGLSSLVVLLEPVAAALLGWLLLGEMLGPWEGLGAMVILAGIVLARRGATSLTK